MNRKGFTLVELLATLVVLSIVLGITIVGIGSTVRNAKIKAEKEFLNQLSDAVDAYMTVCLGGYNKSSSCSEFNDFGTAAFNTIYKSENRAVNVYKSTDNINFDRIISEDILTEKDLINPVNGKKCYSSPGLGKNPITFYRDEDYVYYYKIELPQSCLEYPENNSNVISTLLTESSHTANSSSSSAVGRESIPSSSSSSSVVGRESISSRSSSSSAVGRESIPSSSSSISKVRE